MVGTVYDKGELPWLPWGLDEVVAAPSTATGKCVMELVSLEALCPVDAISSCPSCHPQTQIYDFPDLSSAQIFVLWFWKYVFHFKYTLFHASIQQSY